MAKNRNTYIAGVIAEYNPLHKGHVWHIQKAKELAGSDYCIAVMSGDYVQRGAPAIYDKYTRTAMALEAGADLVLEMPSIFAVSSAEDFAACGIALLDHLGCVGSVCFGSECGDIGAITRAASVLVSEPAIFTDDVKKQLKSGRTYPQARAHALSLTGHYAEGLLDSPNNILGIEYVKAILRRHSPIRPITLRRQGSGYHDTDFSEGFCSACAIRKAVGSMADGTLPDTVLGGIPDFVHRAMELAHSVFPDDFSVLLNAALLKLSDSSQPFEQYLDVSGDLAARIVKELLSFTSFEERICSLKTRQYTYTRISRALIHILLGITYSDVRAGRAADYAPYARVLGFNRQSSSILSDIKKRGNIPLITKIADAGNLLGGTAWEMFKKDLFCSHLYQTVVCEKYHIHLKNEYTNSVIVKP